MSLKQLSVLSVLACTLSIPSITSAADLSVRGQIQADGACSITLGNGGVADFGNLSRTEGFSNGSARREIPLTINCQNPTKVGVDVIDNRKGTASIDAPWEFGLSNPAIGSYLIDATAPLVDGRVGVTIWRNKGENTWGDKGRYLFWGSRKTASWDMPGPQSEPVAFKTLTGSLNIIFFPEWDSAFTDEFELDGSATLELVYL